MLEFGSDLVVLGGASPEGECSMDFYDSQASQWTSLPSVQRTKLSHSKYICWNNNQATYFLGGVDPQDQKRNTHILRLDMSTHFRLLSSQSNPNQSIGHSGYDMSNYTNSFRDEAAAILLNDLRSKISRRSALQEEIKKTTQISKMFKAKIKNTVQTDEVKKQLDDLKKQRDEIFDEKALEKIVLDGIPAEIRPGIWQIICNLDELKTSMLKEFKKANKEIKNIQTADDLYKHYMTQREFEDKSQVHRDLLRDLGRTSFERPSYRITNVESGQNPLFNMMNAYAHYDKEVGYKTGMSHIMSCLYNIVEDEAQCFYLFVHVMKHLDWRKCFIGGQMDGDTA